MRITHRLLALALPIACAGLFASCSNDETKTTGTTSGPSAGGTGGVGGSGGTGGSAPDPSAVCKALSLSIQPFSAGPYGKHRGEIADDFTLDLADGTTWGLKERFSGCEVYTFVPDRIPISEDDATSVWESDKDLASLVKDSPRNTHWFFVSRQAADGSATTAIQGMQARVDAFLATQTPEDAVHWKERLHVVAKKATSLGNWVTDVLGTHGKIGFSIDRRQRVRGAGHLADVKRYSSILNNAGKWPWKSNLAYAAHEPQYHNAQATLQDRLDADGATVVEFWKGETLAEFADTTVMLPSAAEMATFDTLEVEVTQQCPDPELPELGNCGAWDYLAALSIEDDQMMNQVEIARFITSYHRETHWVEDISPMLALLSKGGQQSFRWSFAPPWNTQPTATKLALRFSNQKKGIRPVEATFLWSGGGFGAAYNMNHPPVDVPIPADAKKVELWAITTGHGANTNQCAEFCNHQHEFSVNGKPHLQEFIGAGNNTGCIDHLQNGMTPNQAGTWWFGRGGWCPGQQVDPWSVDVTSEVVKGQTATISYRGLFNMNDPPPDNSGDIDLISYLVVYK